MIKCILYGLYLCIDMYIEFCSIVAWVNIFTFSSSFSSYASSSDFLFFFLLFLWNAAVRVEVPMMLNVLVCCTVFTKWFSYFSSTISYNVRTFMLKNLVEVQVQKCFLPPSAKPAVVHIPSKYECYNPRRGGYVTTMRRHSRVNVMCKLQRQKWKMGALYFSTLKLKRVWFDMTHMSPKYVLWTRYYIYEYQRIDEEVLATTTAMAILQHTVQHLQQRNIWYNGSTHEATLPPISFVKHKIVVICHYILWCAPYTACTHIVCLCVTTAMMLLLLLLPSAVSALRFTSWQYIVTLASVSCDVASHTIYAIANRQHFIVTRIRSEKGVNG